MPISIKVVVPIKTPIAIHLMISFVIHAFEDMRIWLTVIRQKCEQTLVGLGLRYKQ